MKPQTGRRENMTMRALYLIAIVFVVDGHTCFEDMFDMRGLFRYYSFHLMLFAFASGYLLRDGDTAHPLRLLARPRRLRRAVHRRAACRHRRRRARHGRRPARPA